MKSKIFREQVSNPSDLVNFDNFSNKTTSKLARKVFESIYPRKRTPSPDKFEVSQGKPGPETQDRSVNLSPIPLKYYRDPRKPKQTPWKAIKTRQNSLLSPARPKISHHKVNSYQYPLSTHETSKSPGLLPISRHNGSQSKHEKVYQCEALNHLASYCESFIRSPLVKFDSERKRIVRGNEEINIITKNIQNYGMYEGNVQKELVRYSNDSRLEMDKERASIVGQIKSGSFDPNKTIVKIKARLKRKTGE